LNQFFIMTETPLNRAVLDALQADDGEMFAQVCEEYGIRPCLDSLAHYYLLKLPSAPDVVVWLRNHLPEQNPPVLCMDVIDLFMRAHNTVGRRINAFDPKMRAVRRALHLISSGYWRRIQGCNTLIEAFREIIFDPHELPSDRSHKLHQLAKDVGMSKGTVARLLQSADLGTQLNSLTDFFRNNSSKTPGQPAPE
jgi:hypothetical protein